MLKVLKVLRVLRVLVLMVLPAACGSPARPSESGAPPSTLVSDFDGIWVGEYRVTDCTGRHCGDSLLGRTQPFVLRLRQNGISVSGYFEPDRNVGIDVTGSVSSDGQVRMDGSMVPVSGGLFWSSATELVHFTASVDPGVGLRGSFRYVQRPPPGFETGQIERAGEFVRASRVPIRPADAAAGTWRGLFVVQECVVTGLAVCWPVARGEVSGVQLQLSQRGSDVSGTMMLDTVQVAVEGRVSDGFLRLQGLGRDDRNGVTSELRLTDWTATVDEIGRLSGAIAYTYDRRSSASQSSTTVTRAELRHVVVAADP